ncbi:MAG TPA: isoprenylcysteine carboxylmethyltransferase family protein [Methyloceanibacter sp.]|jgi:protein-S-isoprenylcysteine O-methyltransferase Ste14|nr:isoprenylcysteine carboxylmethyltransferase family protein [Methyloceanibacter sp.]
MNANDHAEVAIMPPILFLGALAAGALLSFLIPIGPGLGSANALALTVGLTFVLIGFALVARSVHNFRLARTSVVPSEPATALVATGPYRFTRNPIYIGFVLAYFGFAIVLTSMWVLLLLIPVLVILQRGVVLREEAYLERKFGDVYCKYKARVPRWL